MRRFIRYMLRALLLILIAMGSAVTAMRFAIHGREVRVPNMVGLTPAKAEQLAITNGLAVEVADRFYSADVPEGAILSQAPVANTKVRRGWRVRVAESLGAQRAPVPNVVGESARAAEINITRRGLEIGTRAEIHLADATEEGQVVAQDPPGESANVVSRKVGLLLAKKPEQEFLLMPLLVGRPASEVQAMIGKAGLPEAKLVAAAAPQLEPSAVVPSPAGASAAPAKPHPSPEQLAGGVVTRQTPVAGNKITRDTQIILEVTPK